MSRGFAYCNEHLLHLLWFNVAGAHLGPPTTVSTPSARVFIPLGHVTDTGRRAGGCSNCKGSVLGLWAGCQTQQQQGHLIYALLSLSSVLCSFPSFSFPIIFSLLSPNSTSPLFCPQNQAPLTNTLQEKLQQSEKDEVCPQLASSPPPAEAAEFSLREDASSLLRNCRIMLIKATI